MRVSIYVAEVSGRTYDIKEELKRLGLRWDGDRKVWKGTVSEKELNELGKLADKFPIYVKTRRFLREEEEEYTNSTWVRCWECGRLVPPGQATKDNGWYCGC